MIHIVLIFIDVWNNVKNIFNLRSKYFMTWVHRYWRKLWMVIMQPSVPTDRYEIYCFDSSHQAFSQDLKSGHPKYTKGPVQNYKQF